MNFNDATTIGFFSGILLIACLHGLLLTLILAFHKGFRSKANKFLSLAILGACFILVYEFVDWFSLDEHLPTWTLYLPLYIRSIIPAGFFYFVIFLINPKHQLTRFEKQGFTLIILEVVLAFSYIPIGLFVEDVNKATQFEYIIDHLSWLIGIIASFTLLPLALKKVKVYQQFLFNNYSTTERKNLNWLKNSLVIMLVIAFLSVISFIQYLTGYQESADFTFVLLTLCLVIMLFGIGYFIAIEYRWFEVESINLTNNEKQIIPNKLSSNTQRYYSELMVLLQDKKAYENVNLTLNQLAKELQISSGYLSQIIKENEQKTFFEFINTFRVNAVKQKLLDSNYKDYTIMGIAFESGFNSKSTFNSVFKKIAKETPSAFKKRQS